MNVVGRILTLFLFANLSLFSFGSLAGAQDSGADTNDQPDLSDEIAIIKTDSSVPQPGEDSSLIESEQVNLRFPESDDPLYGEKRAKLIAIGRDTLLATIFKDLQRNYMNDASSTAIEIPFGPRLDLDALNPEIEGKSAFQKKKLLMQKYLMNKRLDMILTEFKSLTVEQLADFLLKKEERLKMLADALLKLSEKWKAGKSDSPEVIKRVNKFVRTVNNAFYNAPLNAVNSNTFGIQVGGFNGVVGLSPGTIGDEYLHRFNFYKDSREGLRRFGGRVENWTLALQKAVEKRLDRPHLKPWVQFRGEFGAYLSIGATPVVSVRFHQKRVELNLELYSETEVFKTSLTPVLQVYAGETTGIFMESRPTGREKLFTYVRRFIPFTAIYGKGEKRMSVVGGTSIIPNIPALVQTNAYGLYLLRIPLNEAAYETQKEGWDQLYKDMKSEYRKLCKNKLGSL